MRALGSPDIHHYNAAVGWLELGNRVEARAEWEQISAGERLHPAVLELEWSLAAAEGDWEAGYAVAQRLITAVPTEPAGWLHAAYALRRIPTGGVAAAQEFLLPAADLFPEEPVIPFNLACYACQLQELAAARAWLRRAQAVGQADQIVAMAKADEDLRALWPEL